MPDLSASAQSRVDTPSAIEGEVTTGDRHSVREIFLVFLKLGCTSFGGPLAHLGYFQNEFVSRRRWIDETAFADTVALCQFLPGPTSSQVGLALGLKRGGWRGALAAWLGFTMPSALLMLAFAYGVRYSGNLAHAGWLQGLKAAAAAVVAKATLTMAKKLCPDAPRAIIAAAAAALLLFAPSSGMQIIVLAGGALAGMLTSGWFKKEERSLPASPSVHGKQAGLGWLGSFLAILCVLPWLAHAWPAQWLQVFTAFFRAGSLVFGGGHVVLPLLERTTVDRGWLGRDAFLAGYGAAQALPGPLFAFAAYLGALIPPAGILGGFLALAAIYLPTVFLVFGTMPHWDRLRAAPRMRSCLAGTNAAVVGLLGAAFCSISASTITGKASLVLMLAAYAGFEFANLPPWMIVLASALAGEFVIRG